MMATSLRAKLTLHLVAPLAFLFVLNSLDRVNVSFAALRMNAELHFSPATYGLGASVFFAGYILFQLPHALSQRVLGARLWIALTMLVWGLLATAMAFITGATQFFLLRFLLGVAEGGFAPGALSYLSQWAPRRFRGWMTAFTMIAIPLSVMVGGPLSGWLMERANPAGWPGWRWMFLLEGLPAVLLSGVALRVFVDRPEEARWLTEAEKLQLREEISSERPPHEGRSSAALRSRAVWIAAALWFCVLAGSFGLIFWLPQVIKEGWRLSDLRVGLVTALPWLAIAAGMLLNAWHSDRTDERVRHLAIPAVAAGVCLMLTTTSPAGRLALGLITVAGFFLGAAQGCFWPLPLRLLQGGAAAASGIAVINMCGNLSGLLAPWAIGWLRVRTASFQAPVFVMAGLLFLAALLAACLRPQPRPR